MMPSPIDLAEETLLPRWQVGDLGAQEFEASLNGLVSDLMTGREDLRAASQLAFL